MWLVTGVVAVRVFERGVPEPIRRLAWRIAGVERMTTLNNEKSSDNK